MNAAGCERFSRWQGRILLLALLSLTGADQTRAAVLQVTSTADDGPGTLRQAITLANTSSPPSTITFNISGSGNHTISLMSPLPNVGSRITIDGTTQPGYGSFPVIYIDGSSVTNGSGFEVTSSGVTIKGLTGINFHAGNGLLGVNAQLLAVLSCNFASNAYGGIELAYCTSCVVDSCVASSNGNAGVTLIGGANCTVRSCDMCANSGEGMYLACSNATVSNCIFGLGPSGQMLAGPQNESVFISGAVSPMLISNIFAVDFVGVYLSGGTNALIQGNTFGFLKDGTNPANLNEGIFIYNGSLNTWVTDCDFGNCPGGCINVGFTGDSTPSSQGTWVACSVFGANAATGFPYRDHEFKGGPLPPFLSGPGSTGPAIFDYNGINSVCKYNIAYNVSPTCFQAAPGVNTTFLGCLKVGASTGTNINTAAGVPAPVITQVLNSGFTITPTVNIFAQPNSSYTVWFGDDESADNEVRHYIGSTTVMTDGTGYGTSVMEFTGSFSPGSEVYGYAIGPNGATSLRSSGLAALGIPDFVLDFLSLANQVTSGDPPGTFELTISNRGLAPATNVVVSMGPDPFIVVPSVFSSQGTASNSFSGVLWQIPALGVGSNANLQAVYQPAYVTTPATADFFAVASADNALVASTSQEIAVNPITIAATRGSGGTVKVTTPAQFSSSLLQAQNLIGAPWVTVPSSNRVTVGNSYVYTLPTSNTMGFYRWLAPSVPNAATTIVYQAVVALDGAPPSAGPGVGLLVTQCGDGPSNFVNLVAGPPGTNNLTTNQWVIRNLPVVRRTNSPFAPVVVFPLGTNYGNLTLTNVVEYSLSITTNTLSTPNFTNTAVTNSLPIYPVIFKHGIQTNAPLIFTNRVTSILGAFVVGTAYAQTNFPNREQGVNECVPSAIINSLQYLSANFNSKSNLVYSVSNLSYTTLKSAVQWTPGGAPTSWPTLKSQYMTSNNIPIVTEVTTNFTNAMTALSHTNDVEIEITGHAAGVVAIQQLATGIYMVQIAHDIRQGQPGGTVVQTIAVDPTTGAVSGLPWGDSKFVHFVIEHPPP